MIIVTRSFQPEPPTVAIVRQNGRSSASCRASVAVTPVSRQIWWVQVVDGRPQARLHSCVGRSPSLVLVQICRIWFAGTPRRSLATCPKRPSLRLQTMYETSNRPVRCKTSSLDTKSCRMRRWHRTWNESSLFQSTCVRVQVAEPYSTVVWVTWSICGASWRYRACSDSRHSRVFSLH